MSETMGPREFCALERQLVERMGMRKKRRLAMGPTQALKLRLLDYLERAEPDAASFKAAIAEAVQAVSADGATGPAQAVASDLALDWDLARTSAGFVSWLRSQAAPRPDTTPTA